MTPTPTKQPSRRPTLRDVATASGASVKTVSRVVNNEEGVRPELEKKVRDAVSSLGYQPDHRARFLRNRASTSGTIGFVQIDASNPFFAAINRGLEVVAREAGYVVVAASSDADQQRQDDIIGALISRRVDALAVVPAAANLDSLAAEIRLGTPLVFIDQAPVGFSADVVATDHRAGGVIATCHLLDHGHRRIAMLGDKIDYPSARSRLAGYEQGLTEAGIEISTDLIRMGVGSVASSQAAMIELLDLVDPPTAVFAGQNLVAIGVIRALRERGLQHEVAVVGFDDLELADLLEPPLTVVPQDPLTLGRRAAERLLARLDGYEGPHEVELLKPELIVRGSGEIRPRI